ncbi:uncharacterized protein LOC128727498 [Anopheles nili]|uniref:uncharacterized protein LOC128727498 n=1 Tax=Anopheles nili TaxID=185578 RepID=UPI00237A9E50|nr:uncharacterized protein LOC128727498 [Anopheles nili]
MKALLCIALLAVVVSVTIADRSESLSLFTQLKVGKQGRLFGAEDDFVSLVQSELVLAQEEYVRSSISGESQVLQELSTAAAQTSGPQCVEFVRQKAGIMMNLAGVSYGSCLKQVDEVLFEKLSAATEHAITRDQYDQANILSAFRGENIFVDPASIRGKMQQRMRVASKVPALSAESLGEIRKELNEVKEHFVKCMKTAQDGLENTLQATSKQLRLVCANEQE